MAFLEVIRQLEFEQQSMNIQATTFSDTTQSRNQLFSSINIALLEHFDCRGLEGTLVDLCHAYE